MTEYLNLSNMDVKFGRKTPDGDPRTWDHVLSYPYHRMGLPVGIAGEKNWLDEVPQLLNPIVREFYNQNSYNYGKGCNGCVGASLSEWLTIAYSAHSLKRFRLGSFADRLISRNREKLRLFYYPWLYHTSQLEDPDQFTTPEADNGAYINTAAYILLTKGHVRWNILWGTPQPRDESKLTPRKFYRIAYYYWMQSVTQIADALMRAPIVVGIPWYEEFMNPVIRDVMIDGERKKEYWIGTRDNWGKVLGGHAECMVAISMMRQGALLLGTWGMFYPPVWIGLDAIDKLRKQNSEFCAPEVTPPVPPLSA